MTTTGRRFSQGKGNPRKRLEDAILFALDVVTAQGRTPIPREELTLEVQRASGRTHGEIAHAITRLHRAKRLTASRGLVRAKKSESA